MRVALVGAALALVGACAPAETCTRELAGGARWCDEAPTADAWPDRCADGTAARGECPRAGALETRCRLGAVVRRYYAPGYTRELAAADCRAYGGTLE
jgi:hypothetical protein